MLQNRTSQELAEIRQLIAGLQGQIDTLVRYFSALPTPPRARWERRSLPAMDETDPALIPLLPTQIMPATPGDMPATHQDIPRITRITACRSGNQMFVTAYNGNDRVMSGTSRQIGARLIQWYPDLKWEVVAESA